MNYLSLFSGGGLGDLAHQWLFEPEDNHTCIGYVEVNDDAQQILRARIDDGSLDRAPIFGDIRAFTAQGYAAQYRGVAELVTGGFPCQPYSRSGQQQGQDDERDMWPALVEVLREVAPRIVHLENVPAVLRLAGGAIFGDLHELGYDAQWQTLQAAAVGAPHLRDRLWIVAHARDGIWQAH